jgi:hypothetical protein
MSATLLAALVIQLLSVGILRARLGRRWLGRPFTLFVLMATVFHGISEVLIRVAPAGVHVHSPRWSIEQSYIDEAAFMVSVGLLVAVLGYVIVARPVTPGPPPLEIVRSMLRPLDWRITGLAVIPFLLATVAGRGYGNLNVFSLNPAAILVSLSNTFLVILVVLTAFLFVVRYGRRWLVAALVTQSVLLAVAGQRLELFVGAVVLLCLLHAINMRLGRRGVVIALSIAAVAAMGITSARETVGREHFRDDSGLVGRTEVIAAGVLSPPDSVALLADAASRFDANVFAGQVDRSVQSGSEQLGVTAILDSLLVPIPSLLYSVKHDSDRARLVEYKAVGQLTVVPMDYAPGSIGPYLGAVGRQGLLVLMLFVGLAFALAENWLFRRLTLNRILILASLLQGALFFEREIAGMVTFLRTGLLLILAATMLRWLLPRLRRHRHGSESQEVHGVVHP